MNAARTALAASLLAVALAGVAVGLSLSRPRENSRPEGARRVADHAADVKEAATLTADAKEVALAAMKCAADAGDVYPGPGDFRAKVAPYLDGKGGDFGLFRWEYPGGPWVASQSTSPAPVLGRYGGRSGEAVVRLDGAAEWHRK